jgi:hypothetical protein
VVKKIIWASLILLFLGGCLLIGTNCAGIVAPSFGPPDRTPPEVAETYPLPHTLNFKSKKLHMEFSKYVDHRSAEQAIFFSPSVGKMKFDWGGKGVDMEFRDSLRPNTTYIMTLGTDVEDLQNNRMAKSFALPFSTGNKIDSASIAGKVFDRSPEGVLIYAFDLQYKNPDTLNPALNKPDFLTQTGKDGSFLLPYLRVGKYRVMAVRDEYRNVQYDRQVDGYAMLPADVILTQDSSHAKDIQFRLSKEDTTRPFVASVISLDKNRLLVRFSKVIDTTSLKLQYVRAYDTLSQASLELKELSVFGDSAITAQVVTSDQPKGKVCRLFVANLQDLHGNSISLDQTSTVFTGEDAPDTTRPEFKIINNMDGSRTVEADDSVYISFDKAVARATFESAFTLMDSSKKKIDGSFTWWRESKAAFVPAKPLAFGMPYTGKIVLDSIRAVAGGRNFKDSTFTFRFQTLQSSTLSSVKGEVIDELPAGTGRIFIRLYPVNADNTRSYRQVLAKPGKFSFENIPDGRYSFFVFRDSDGNGVYSSGRPYPFQPAERFSAYSDTLKLRARWPLEGVVIRIKN